MEKNTRGLLWVALVLLLLLFGWWGSQNNWWSNGVGTNHGASPSPSSMSNSSLNSFYNSTSSGESKQQVSSSSQSKNLSENCTLIINTSTLKREICVYTSASGSGSVTVTYQNNKVTSVTKFGF